MPDETDDRVEVGRRIKRLRQTQEITVQELAKRSGISPGYLSEVERGIPAVSVAKLRQIASGLGVGLDSLVDGEGSETPVNGIVSIPAALSNVADELNLSHRATLALLQGKRSLKARRSSSEERDWTEEDWRRFHDQVKDYLPEC